MFKMEFRNSRGHRVAPDQFARQFATDLHKHAIDIALKHLTERAHGAAASITDPETGKHASVFVRRTHENKLMVSTRGSPAFARELEKRLGVEQDSIMSMSSPLKDGVPRVYLAHASEDKETLARPLAERLMADGIDVWLDEWEISSGDSLRRRMEEGLGACTHFVVLLTPHSLGKPWVEEEIDAGFVRAVGGKSKFIGVRVDVEVKGLSPFLQARRCPSIQLSNESEIAALIADIYGVSRKPERGSAPRYVKTVPEGLRVWSPSAVAIAEYLVRNSKNGTKFDPQTRNSKVAEATSLPDDDIRLGVLDLEDSGLIERSKSIGSDEFWPRIGLFVEFDRHFLGFDNERDAVVLANWLTSNGTRSIKSEELAPQFPDWSVRRLNSALNYLEDAQHTLGEAPWTMRRLRITDRTRRFVRDHG